MSLPGSQVFRGDRRGHLPRAPHPAPGTVVGQRVSAAGRSAGRRATLRSRSRRRSRPPPQEGRALSVLLFSLPIHLRTLTLTNHHTTGPSCRCPRRTRRSGGVTQRVRPRAGHPPRARRERAGRGRRAVHPLRRLDRDDPQGPRGSRAPVDAPTDPGRCARRPPLRRGGVRLPAPCRPQGQARHRATGRDPGPSRRRHRHGLLHDLLLPRRRAGRCPAPHGHHQRAAALCLPARQLTRDGDHAGRSPAAGVRVDGRLPQRRPRRTRARRQGLLRARRAQPRARPARHHPGRGARQGGDGRGLPRGLRTLRLQQDRALRHARLHHGRPGHPPHLRHRRPEGRAPPMDQGGRRLGSRQPGAR